MSLTVTIILVAAAVLLHELGHVVAAMITRSRIDHIGINWIGPHIRITVDPPHKRKCLVNLFCGPCVNLVLSIFLLSGNELLSWFGFMNGLLFIGSIVIPKSDGWQMIKLWSDR